MTNGNALVPPNYVLIMQLSGQLHSPAMSATETVPKQTEFEEALTHSSFPQAMLDASLAELATWNAPSNSSVAPAADYLSLSDGNIVDEMQGLSTNTQASELDQLKKQLASLQRIQKVTFQQLSALQEEKEYFVRKEHKRNLRKKHKAKPKSAIANGSASDVEMTGDGSSDSGSDTSSDEAAPSE